MPVTTIDTTFTILIYRIIRMVWQSCLSRLNVSQTIAESRLMSSLTVIKTVLFPSSQLIPNRLTIDESKVTFRESENFIMHFPRE
ncbi:hypothetical protein RTE01_06890 [Raoultella terrigena]|nr:hypothetical protein RTE01_06890 [Raoultella terrigena]